MHTFQVNGRTVAKNAVLNLGLNIAKANTQTEVKDTLFLNASFIQHQISVTCITQFDPKTNGCDEPEK